MTEPRTYWWYPEDGDPHEDGTDWDELLVAAWPDRLEDATPTPPSIASTADPEAGGAGVPTPAPPQTSPPTTEEHES